MKHVSGERRPKVPQIIQDLSEATRRDIVPAARLMSRIFVGTLVGGEGSFMREVVGVAAAKATAAKAPPPAAPSPRARPAAKAKSSYASPSSAATDHNGAIIIDAEIIEEHKGECQTCGGSHKVGRAGHEVRCPACR